jgi:hypothetical protein
MSLFPSELAAKSVQLLKRLPPSARLIGYLINPSSPATSVYTSEASAAAKALGNFNPRRQCEHRTRTR